jgi:hypothetical protein
VDINDKKPLIAGEKLVKEYVVGVANAEGEHFVFGDKKGTTQFKEN